MSQLPSCAVPWIMSSGVASTRSVPSSAKSPDLELEIVLRRPPGGALLAVEVEDVIRALDAERVPVVLPVRAGGIGARVPIHIIGEGSDVELVRVVDVGAGPDAKVVLAQRAVLVLARVVVREVREVQPAAAVDRELLGLGALLVELHAQLFLVDVQAAAILRRRGERNRDGHQHRRTPSPPVTDRRSTHTHVSTCFFTHREGPQIDDSRMSFPARPREASKKPMRTEHPGATSGRNQIYSRKKQTADCRSAEAHRMSAVLNRRTRSAPGHCGDYLCHVDASPVRGVRFWPRAPRVREQALGTGRPRCPPESKTPQAP